MRKIALQRKWTRNKSNDFAMKESEKYEEKKNVGWGRGSGGEEERGNYMPLDCGKEC